MAWALLIKIIAESENISNVTDATIFGGSINSLFT